MNGKYTAPLVALAVLIAAAIVLSVATYTVGPAEAVLELHDGKVTAVNTDAGLHWKLPLFQSLVRLDARTRLSRGRVRLHGDRKGSLAIGYAILWKITEPRRYYEATGGDAAVADRKIKTTLAPILRKAMSKGDARDFLAQPTAELDTKMAAALQPVADQIGVTVLEVEPTTAAVPASLADQVAATMAATVQTKISAAKVSAKAERNSILDKSASKSDKIIAAAKQQAATITGKSQARLAALYAPVARKAPEFFNYFLELESRADALQSNTRILVLSMDSPWFQDLDKANGSSKDSQ